MLTNGKSPAEALRPGPTTTCLLLLTLTATCLLTYHCLLLMADETTETGETRESSDTYENSENIENIVSDRTGRGVGLLTTIAFLHLLVKLLKLVNRFRLVSLVNLPVKLIKLLSVGTVRGTEAWAYHCTVRQFHFKI